MEKDFSDEDELFNAVAKTLEEEKLASSQEAPDAQSNTSTNTSMATMFVSAKRNSKLSVKDILEEPK